MGYLMSLSFSNLILSKARSFSFYLYKQWIYSKFTVNHIIWYQNCAQVHKIYYEVFKLYKIFKAPYLTFIIQKWSNRFIEHSI